MVRSVKSWLLTLLIVLAGPVLAQDAPSAAADPVLEKRVMAISEELRCLVCQNQTIADSHADLAVDLKNQVREMLRKGMSEKAIKAYMVERYGDFVLYRPPVKSTTWVLWVGPFGLLAAGLAFLAFKLRQRARRQKPGVDDLDDQEQRRVAALLASEQEQTARGS
jgi:cytochrome c-type biogenesis protein CcmH